MITQEEIGYTKEEISAMMKTIDQLRKEKKELIDKVCEFIRINAYKYRQLKFVKNKATFDFRTDRLIEDLRNNL